MFIGRKEELETLRIALDSDRQENILIYGRRRVGKTELIKEAIKDRRAIYFEAKETTEKLLVKDLELLIREVFNTEKSFFSVEECIRYVFDKSSDDKLVFVLDEYTYIRKVVKGLDSIIQSVIDEYKHKSKVKFIIAGSYVDTMKSLVLSDNPLYGRFYYEINLKQMDYYESSMFYKNMSDSDKVVLYSIFGGVPFYNSLVNDNISVKDNIINLLLNPHSILFSEVESHLKNEISKIENANAVFEVIALGASKFNDILDKSHITYATTLSEVLTKLIKMEVIRKDAPINDLNNKKKTKYYINDNLALFYYKYMFRYRSQLAVMNKEVFYKRYIEKDLLSYHTPIIFEDICKQFLIRKNMNNELEEPFSLIGRYYYDDIINKTNGEFDIVTEDDIGYIFYECKYKDKKVDDEIIDKEIEQVKKTDLNCYKYGFFSKSGFNIKENKNLLLYTLQDLYK